MLEINNFPQGQDKQTEYQCTYRRIKDIPKYERPMEKLQSQGLSTMSDTELLAILLRTGLKGKNAVELAGDILRGRDQVQGREYLQQVDAEELKTFSGIGNVKAYQLVTALELGKRVFLEDKKLEVKFSEPETIWKYLGREMSQLRQEELRVLSLNAKNYLIRMQTVSIGGQTSSIIRPREIFNFAIRANAASIVMVHNHPSGDPKPSDDDYLTTKLMLKAGQLMGIPLQDHLVIGKEAFVSLRRDSELWKLT